MKLRVHGAGWPEKIIPNATAVPREGEMVSLVLGQSRKVTRVYWNFATMEPEVVVELAGG